MLLPLYVSSAASREFPRFSLSVCHAQFFTRKSGSRSSGNHGVVRARSLLRLEAANAGRIPDPATVTIFVGRLTKKRPRECLQPGRLRPLFRILYAFPSTKRATDNRAKRGSRPWARSSTRRGSRSRAKRDRRGRR